MSELAEEGFSPESVGLTSTELTGPASSIPDISSEGPDTFGLFSTLSELGLARARLDLSEFDTHEPLGILVELAKNGTIDPWDVDIVELTDSFLGRVEELKQMDLRISSRTLLFSAILLRMKSSGIFQEEEEVEDDYDLFEDMDFPKPDQFPIPRFPVRRIATRPVTLNELIVELKKAEKTLSRKNEKKRLQALETGAGSGPVPFQGDVLEIAHEEAIVERVEVLWETLAELFWKNSCVTFSDLMVGSSDRVMDYISLLFLASNKKVWLCQKELFGELYIYPGEDSGFSIEKKALSSDLPPLSDEMLPGPRSTELSGVGSDEPVFEGTRSDEPGVGSDEPVSEGTRSDGPDGPDVGSDEPGSGDTTPLSSEVGFAEVNPGAPESLETKPFEE